MLTASHTENAMATETTVPISTDAPRSPAPIARWLIVGNTLLICALVLARVPLWGVYAWGIHEAPNFVGNLPLLVMLLALFGAHFWWTKTEARPARGARWGRALVLCVLALGLSLSARLGEGAGFGRLALLTINPASGGFFEAAYDSQGDPNWLANYPALMKDYHHVHSHPPAPVALMRWWIEHKSPALTSAADDFLAISPGTNATALAQLASDIWKRPYNADDIGAAFFGGLMWLLMGALVPACVYVAAGALFGERAAVHGGALTCAVPSLLMFVPGADLSYLACAALALALAALGCARYAAAPKLALALLAGGGVVAALGVTGSFAGAWAIILTATFLALRGPFSLRERLVQAGVYAGAGVMTLVALRFLGMDWLLFWRSLIAFNVDADVAPVARFFYHLADFWVFLGLPISVALWWGLGRSWALRRLWRARRVASDEPNVVANRDILALALPVLAVLLLLNTVISMAETARIWMLFMPPLLVAIAGTLSDREATGLARWVLGAQLVQTWVFLVWLNVWSF